MIVRKRKRESELTPDGLKGHDDMSAEERFYNRSVKIRDAVLMFMREFAGEKLWDSWEDLAADCGNWIREKKYHRKGASMQVCRRWLYQYSKDSAASFCAFRVVSQPAGLVIMER